MLRSRGVLWKKVESFPKVFTREKHAESKISIEKRIERGPTDILKALASTVGRDPVGYHYKYPDDPYFYSNSNWAKRQYALSLESGRKSARWIIEKNPSIFKHELADPPIEAFLQKPLYENQSEVTEMTLINAIEKRCVSDAITVYNILQKSGTLISNDSKQRLLELVCFYNCSDKKSEIELEEKWFENTEKIALEVNTWKEQNFAEVLFESMNPKCPLANSAIIQGMFKYNCGKKAFELYQEAVKNNVKLHVGVYNALLGQVSSVNVNVENGIEFIKETLMKMASEKINPNIGTLNATLKTLSNMNHFQKVDNFVKQLLLEFTKLGIPFSLGTYYYVFEIFGSSKAKMAKNKDLFVALLNLAQAEVHEIRHPSDFKFFPFAMKLFAFYMKDVDLYNLVNKILCQRDNSKFLENSLDETMYYRNYLRAVFANEPIDVAMQKYRTLVPTVYLPDFNIFGDIFCTVAENLETNYLVEIWNDIKSAETSKYVKLLIRVISFVNICTEESALKVFHEAALNFLQILQEKGVVNIELSESFSNLIVIFVRSGDYNNASQTFESVKQLNEANELVTPISIDALQEYYRYAISNRIVPLVLDLLNYVESEGYSQVGEMAELALPLVNENEKERLSKIIHKAKERKKSTE